MQKNIGRTGFRVETSDGVIEASSVVVATGAFQNPVVPQVVPEETEIKQMHSHDYRNPEQLPSMKMVSRSINVVSRQYQAYRSSTGGD